MGKQTIENVQMIQLGAKLWKQEKGFEEYGEKALKVNNYIFGNTVCLQSAALYITSAFMN